MDLSISFEDSIFGTERKILLSKVSYCSVCKGSGAEPNSGWRNVPLAKGRERYTSPGDLFLGRFHLSGNAPSAREKGTIPTKKCSACSGHGVSKKGEEITVNIPPGIRDGEAISMPGLGEAVAGGVAGDLYVKFTVGKHPVFRRENLNLIMDLDVKMSEALLGWKKIL